MNWSSFQRVALTCKPIIIFFDDAIFMSAAFIFDHKLILNLY